MNTGTGGALKAGSFEPLKDAVRPPQRGRIKRLLNYIFLNNFLKEFIKWFYLNEHIKINT